MENIKKVQEFIKQMPTPVPGKPLKILFSSCITGITCGFDGSSYGEYPLIRRILSCPNVQAIKFCPEDFAFGTPRALCNIHGGDGFDVLNGKAKVLTESGEDWTAQMIKAAEEMLRVARENNVDLAIMMDISAACGSQVIYEGHRQVQDPVYKKGSGVCAALLQQNGYKVITQRSFRTLNMLLHKLDQTYKIDETAIDNHETEWYKTYFK